MLEQFAGALVLLLLPPVALFAGWLALHRKGHADDLLALCVAIVLTTFGVVARFLPLPAALAWISVCLVGVALSRRLLRRQLRASIDALGLGWTRAAMILASIGFATFMGLFLALVSYPS